MECIKNSERIMIMQHSYQLLSLLFASLFAAICLAGCASAPPMDTPMASQINKQPFGKTKEGTPVELFTLRNSKGAEARICNYGGLVISLKVPDRDGKLGDVVLGYDNLDGYLKATPYFGAMIGRYGNRIAKGKFTLDGTQY